MLVLIKHFLNFCSQHRTAFSGSLATTSKKMGKYFLLFFTILFFQGCLHKSNPYNEVKFYNPNHTIGLKPSFSKLKAGTVKIQDREVTFVNAYLSSQLISINEYYHFLTDVSKNIEINLIKDSLSNYIDLENSPIKFKNQNLIKSNEGKKPITFVTYFGAKAYCEWLTSKFCKKQNRPIFRLPSEYEWINALNQNTIRKNEQLKEWIIPNRCIITYTPITEGFCEHDWVNSLIHNKSDSTITTTINDFEQKSYTITGESKSKTSSLIGFRVIQTKPKRKGSGHEF